MAKLVRGRLYFSTDGGKEWEPLGEVRELEVAFDEGEALPIEVPMLRPITIEIVAPINPAHPLLRLFRRLMTSRWN